MKSSLSTIKFLLRTGAIPFLIVDYTQNSISLVFCRDNHILHCQFTDIMHILSLYGGEETCTDEISARAMTITEKELEDYIVQSTQVQLSADFLTGEFFEEAISYTSTMYEIYIEEMLDHTSDDKFFSESDFSTLSRLAKQMKKEEDENN